MNCKYCNNPIRTLGLCVTHYKRKQDGWSSDRMTLPIRKIDNRSDMPEYFIYYAMLARCYNKKDKHYKDYGGRGIKVCSSWKNNFLTFLSDMGRRSSKNHCLDRIDNDGNYEPLNCRWATFSEQARNRRIRNTNTSGFKGVSYDKSCNRYVDQLCVEGVYLLRKKLKTIEEAIQARKEAELKYNNDQLELEKTSGRSI